MTTEQRIEHVTCLGCGCGCDDLTVTVSQDRIVDAGPVCPLGREWLGDGQVPWEILADGRPVTLEQALATAAIELVKARGRCLVYLAPDLSSLSQRAAVAIADLLGATVDCDTSETAANGLLTAQRRGRAGATLGEIRNRGDAFLFWGVDPSLRYPRFLARYSLEPVGTHVPGGRSGRDVIAVSVGADRALTGADLTLEIGAEEEITVLSLIRAAVLGHELPNASPLSHQAREVAGRLTRARYAVLVHDAEPTAEPRNPLRAEALLTLAQALNGPTRAALCSLRAGGNRVGAESVLTWQTGYPFAADFSRGYPRYVPGRRGLRVLASHGYKAALIAGSPRIDGAAGTGFSEVTMVVVGPRASEAPFAAKVAIDTGVAGIHEAGIAYRMDEVPQALRASLSARRVSTEVLVALGETIRAELRRSQ
jgi:formylmethanofuran dehydrogenase subunit B